jgi:hypothetical protein
VELEWQGIPSATLVHEALTGSAEAICRVSGMTGYPFITVGYRAGASGPVASESS